MSIRKITDLSALTLARINPDKLNESVFEISYCTEYADFTRKQYQSMYITYGNMQSCILSNVLGDPEHETTADFWAICNFHRQVNMYGGAFISGELSGEGNFDWNMSLNDNYIRNNQYHFNVKSLENKLIGIDYNILSAPKNIFYGDVQYDSSDGGHYALFSEETINLDAEHLQIGPSNARTIEIGNGNSTTEAAGDWTFTKPINGTCIRARWSDVAEYYESDEKYEPGTLVQFGGEKEITIATTDANAVVTTAPGVLLGSDSDNTIKVGIALVGRVPVKVRGQVKRFQNLTMSKDEPGVACVAGPTDKIIAKTLEANNDTGVKLVESVVKLQF